jgi:hypothetical protein
MAASITSTLLAFFAALRKAGFPVYTKIQDAIYAIGTYYECVARQSRREKKNEALRD